MEYLIAKIRINCDRKMTGGVLDYQRGQNPFNPWCAYLHLYIDRMLITNKIFDRANTRNSVIIIQFKCNAFIGKLTSR